MKKVLVANRGEIAVRIIRALRARGLGSVAVYSDADRREPPVRLADEAVRIGPPPPGRSYLVADRILEAARATGADAIHPGYGFLSENADFAERVEAAGLTWIGPPASAIRLMGDKVAARRKMAEAGVPIIPGSTEPVERDGLLATARATGFPLMLKAAGGGGGKGIRIVHEESELLSSFDRAAAEAGAAFGNAAVYVERLLASPRHVEIQILADSHGHAFHVGERECSLQRRHQKILEECPSPSVDRDTCAEMGDAAVRAAEAIGYRNAGTVEFLVDASGAFHFLEMNTRLQVEHPVTEMVYDVDLVGEQLRIANGDAVSIDPHFLQPNGHAIEVRLYAEDPENGFLPSIGRIDHLDLPGGPGVRLDASLYEGQEVPLHYDPLLGKLIVWGGTRGRAIARLRQALRETVIAGDGIRTNVSFLTALVHDQAFVHGDYDTGTVEARLPKLIAPDPSAARVAAIAGALLRHRRAGRPAAPLRANGVDTAVSAWVAADRAARLRER